MKLRTLLERAVYKREYLFHAEDTNAFRIVNGAGDGLEGCIIDYYNGFVLVQVYDSSLYAECNTISSICKDLLNRLGVSVEGILLKDRTKVNDPQRIAELRKSTLIEGKMPPAQLAVKQNNVLANVDLIQGQNTGIFLDMRVVRKRLSGYYGNGGALCNLFCYTGLFSVHALLNGLSSAINVDISRTVLNRAQKNYELNGIVYDNRDFVKADCKDFLKMAVKKGFSYNFFIFDPPTFSRNKKNTFSIKKHYTQYLALIEKLALNGYILTTVNTISLSVEDYKKLHPLHWELVFLEHEPDDFPILSNPYLKAGLWKM